MAAGSIDLKYAQPHGYSAELLACLAMAHRREFAAAERACLVEIARDPSNGWAHDALGLIYCQAHKFPEAVRSFGAATQCANVSIQFYQHLCSFWAAMQQPHGALNAMQNAEITLGPRPEVQLELAICLANVFQGNAAHSIFRELLSKKPDDLSLWLNYAIAMYSSGKLRYALEAFDVLYARDPSAFAAFTSIYIKLLSAVGRDADAAAIRKFELERNKAASNHDILQLDIYDQDDQLLVAEAGWRDRLKTESADHHSLYSLAYNLARQWRWDEAVEYLDQAADGAGHGILHEQIKMLQKAAGVYVPRIMELASIAPSPRRKPGRDIIVIRGGVDPRLMSIIKHYRAAHDGVFIILSTWKEVDAGLLRELEPYIDDIVLNERPAMPGISNINYQVVCAAAGILRAKILGAERVLVTRTDLAVLRPNLMAHMNALLDADSADKQRAPGLGKRIVISELITLVVPLYHASDIFCFGLIDDVYDYWTPENMLESCQPPEITLCRSWAHKVGRHLENTVEDSLSAARDLFILSSPDELQLFWQKYPAASSVLGASNKQFLTTDVWRGAKNFEVRVLPTYLPRINGAWLSEV